MTQSTRPPYSPTQAGRLAEKLFGISGEVRDLPGDRDRNFDIRSNTGARYVLKVSTPETSPARLQFEQRLLRLASEALDPIAIPEPLVDVSGAEFSKAEHRGAQYWIRLLRWVDGIPLANYAPHTPALFEGIGRALGKISLAFKDEVEPLDGSTAAEWNLLTAPATIGDNLASIRGGDRALLLGSLAERSMARIGGGFERLPTQVIYNDANDYNLLVETRDWMPRLAGIIDFGDSATSLRMADLAIAAAYGMLDKPDPLAAAEALTRGFTAVVGLDESEIDALFDCIVLRLCISAVHSERRAQSEPENDYAAISSAPVWRLLTALSDVHPDFARFRLRAAAQLEPDPTSIQVRRYLSTSPVARVMDIDFGAAALEVLDLTPGSTDEVVLADEPTATAALFSRLERGVCDAAIGRYDEPRLAYDSATFQIEAWERTEQRTIHLGIDIIVPAGNAVYAPLAGEVVCADDNEQTQGYGPVVMLRHSPPDGPEFFTLYGHLDRATLTEISVGDTVEAGAQIGRIGRPHENGGWTPHLHLQIATNRLGRDNGLPGVSPIAQRAVWRSLCPDPNQLLGIPDRYLVDRHLGPSTIRTMRDRRLGPSLSLSYDRPLNIVRGIGARLYDELGRWYLDCVNNVCHVGHANPNVNSAANSQMRVLNTNTRYLHENVVRYADELTARMPDGLDVCFFVNSGSEANDLAVRMARHYTQRQGAVVFEGAYHGNLDSLIRLSPYKFDGPGGSGCEEGVFVAPLPDPYAGRHRGEAAFEGYRNAFAAVLDEAVRFGCAAFLFESILSCGGQIDPPAGFLKFAVNEARSRSIVCIADEVQTGFGRVGETFWAFERQGLVPDIVTMGKPIGNGHPLGVVVTTREIADSFANGMEYFNTFGGNPVSCAVGLAVLDAVESDGLQAHAKTVGNRLRRGLEDLAGRHRLIGDVRGAGLFLGIELVLDRGTREPAAAHARYVVNRARAKGVLLSTDGPRHNVIKIKPPLVFSHADADLLLSVLDAILAEEPCQPRGDTFVP